MHIDFRRYVDACMHTSSSHGESSNFRNTCMSLAGPADVERGDEKKSGQQVGCQGFRHLGGHLPSLQLST